MTAYKRDIGLLWRRILHGRFLVFLSNPSGRLYYEKHNQSFLASKNSHEWFCLGYAISLLCFFFFFLLFHSSDFVSVSFSPAFGFSRLDLSQQKKKRILV